MRGILTWAIEAVALSILTHVLPGARVADWQIGAVAVLVIGGLNALVRPIIVLLAVSLGLAPFALIALVLNAFLVIVATRLVPGFTVDTLWTAFLLAFGLAVLNTLLSGLLGINDDDSFYRNVVRWLERRRAPASDLADPGTILIQIDGLGGSRHKKRTAHVA
jgi:putative membrane protein